MYCDLFCDPDIILESNSRNGHRWFHFIIRPNLLTEFDMGGRTNVKKPRLLRNILKANVFVTLNRFISVLSHLRLREMFIPERTILCK